MKLGLERKVALVTASSGGIGLEIARSLATEDAKVIINGRTQASADKAIAEILDCARFITKKINYDMEI